MDVFTTTITLLLQLVSNVVAIILLPISTLIATTMPSIDGVLTNVKDFIDLALTYIGWAIDAMAIPSIVISLIIGYYTFIITVSMGSYLIKLLIKWIQIFRVALK